jgi:undecaprenyl diphosphate synthase
VTVYAFSTENWSRPREEVEALMQLFDRYLDTFLADFDSYDATVCFLGDKGPLAPALREKMEEVERRSRERGSPYTLNLAINYGGRAELCTACNALIAEGKQTVSEADITSHLYTAASPDPDLIVRTAGEMRLSGFLLWQASYAELYFTDRLWPDMQEEDVDRAVEAFLSRTRRFGGVK